MDILTETKHLQNRLDDLRNSQMSIGLVPTMGIFTMGISRLFVRLDLKMMLL